MSLIRVLFVLLLGACAPEAPPVDTGAGASAAEKAAPLTWWYTCGDVVCRGWTRERGVPLCRSQNEGDPCRTDGAECDIRGDGCNVNFRCASTDPSVVCPVSRRSYKSDIRYLSGAELDQVRDDLMSLPLATWRYSAEGTAAASHLGFIIDDAPESPAVSESGETVDLYGYTSMTVAAVQAQQRQIDALQAEVAALRKELAAGSTHP